MSPNPEPPPGAAVERFAAWALGGPLAAALAMLLALQVATWLPSYLTWPWWADHDVFAVAAHGWDAGILPYRDFPSNNFPGTIYVFWLSGKLFGWGTMPPFLAFDAAMLVALGALAAAWSRRRFGSWLPGLVGFGTLLAYMLDLDYSQAAQRDWQGPAFFAAALLIAHGWSGRGAWITSGVLAGIALVFRPQAALLGPAVVLAIDERAREPGEGWRSTAKGLAWWSLAAGTVLVLGALPLVAAGVLDDFVRTLRVVAPGGEYNRQSPQRFAAQLVLQLLPVRFLAVPLAAAILAKLAGPGTWRGVRPWLVAMAAIVLYRPLSPVPHAYLTHPLMLVWSLLVGVLAALVLRHGPASPGRTLAALLVVTGLGMTLKPRFSNPVGSLRALPVLARGELPGPPPTGYVPNDLDTPAAKYPWADYRALIEYLRHETTPGTRVANLLRYDPAVAGPSGRLSALPAESIAWLSIVRPADEPAFAEALRETPDSVVVWAPSEQSLPYINPLDVLVGVVREHYEPAERFGVIEVWRRKAAQTP